MTCFPNRITRHFQKHWQWPATNKIHPSTGSQNCHFQHRPTHDTRILTVPDSCLLLWLKKKKTGKNRLSRKGLISSYTSKSQSTDTEGSQGMNSRWETEAITVKEHCLLSCSPSQAQHLSRTAWTACLGTVPPTVGWTLLYQSTVEKIPHRCSHKLIWLRRILSWVLPLRWPWALCSWHLMLTGTFMEVLGFPWSMNYLSVRI